MFVRIDSHQAFNLFGHGFETGIVHATSTPLRAKKQTDERRRLHHVCVVYRRRTLNGAETRYRRYTYCRMPVIGRKHQMKRGASFSLRQERQMKPPPSLGEAALFAEPVSGRSSAQKPIWANRMAAPQLHLLGHSPSPTCLTGRRTCYKAKKTRQRRVLQVRWCAVRDSNPRRTDS